MSAPQNTIAIVYDYDQTLSPSYMQDEVVFPAFGINSEIFWRRCSELVRDHGYDNELAYMKVLLDQLGLDRPTNEELKKLGAKLNFYQGLPEMSQDVNDHMNPEIRPIPFSNMIYVGDGPTDVPCFTVMKKNGGQAIAVYNPDDSQRVGFKKCYQLATHADRVRHIAPADYRRNTHLRMLLEQMVEETANRVVEQRKLAIESGTVRAPKH